ncbi:hypothetical protein L218DRAFT_920703 [Marasmius fiardii PR-910]|nr:hypothetical protein L218DRAFT_920703 [Marasmius fiardii PR-910]
MSTLDITFDHHQVETLWKWSTGNPRFISTTTLDDNQQLNYTARIVKHKIHTSRSKSNSGITLSTAYLTPRPQLQVPSAPQAPIPVVLKIATGSEQITLLQREASFYENELFHLQGSVVPRYYGLYRGKLLNFSPPPQSTIARSYREPPTSACMILEYCSGHGSIPLSPGELRRRTMIATQKLHQAGVVHGDLLNHRHVLDLGYNGNKGGVRIVDFSMAHRHHRCPQSIGGCQELVLIGS